MTNAQSSINRVLILADQSADWTVAGLSQLERLILALNEFLESTSPECHPDIGIFWKPGMACGKQIPRSTQRLSSCKLGVLPSEFPSGPAVVLSTHLLVRRRGIAEFVGLVPVFQIESASAPEIGALWLQLSEHFAGACQHSSCSSGDNGSVPWRWIDSRSDIPAAERWLLRGSGKKHDGFISRHLNRPLSRAVSRLLLRTRMTPNAWTVLILLLPAAACVFLSRGTYSGFVLGTALYQLHSMLDGCDGEIARAKYLDSDRGPGVDALGDLTALLLFTFGLGIGLFRMAGASAARWVFITEAILAFILISSRLGPHAFDLLARGPAAVRSSEHDDSLRLSGQQLLGPGITSLLFAITKRDVVFFAFLVLAILGLTPWILHLLFFYSLGSAVLLLKGRRMRYRDAVGA